MDTTIIPSGLGAESSREKLWVKLDPEPSAATVVTVVARTVRAGMAIIQLPDLGQTPRLQEAPL